ncbi:MAG: inner membrane protein, partial [Litorivivens sp.]
MDPITQGALGAVLPQSTIRSSEFRDKALTISWVGCLAGMSPDLDVLIRSSTDPILFLEFHRQFTHALIFIPLGALICALAFHYWARKRLSFRMTYLVSLLGYSTHALLDTCTTYGTQLFWPFADTRVTWNIIAVVDPLATLPLLALVITSAVKANPLYARAGLLWFLTYLSIGWVQHNRADSAAAALASSRGHDGVAVSVKPGFANLLLWKSVYEFQDRYYVDAVRAGLTTTYYEGPSVAILDVARDLPWLDLDTQQGIDLQRFRWFSMGYLALDPERDDFIVDVRYS